MPAEIDSFIVKVANLKQKMTKDQVGQVYRIFRGCGVLSRYMAQAAVREHPGDTVYERQQFDLCCKDYMHADPKHVRLLARVADLEVELFGPLTVMPERMEKSLPVLAALEILKLQTPKERADAYAIYANPNFSQSKVSKIVSQVRTAAALSAAPPAKPAQIAPQGAAKPRKAQTPAQAPVPPPMDAQGQDEHPWGEWEAAWKVAGDYLRNRRVSGLAVVDYRKKVSVDLVKIACWIAEARS